MEPKYKVNPLTGELQEYVFEYNGILALRNFTAKVEDERLILHAADDVNFSILEALVSEVEINGVVYDNPTAAQEALTRLTFNQNRPVLLDKTLKDLILGAVQKVEGKGLSSNDFTNAYKQQLDTLEDYDIELDESTTELKFKKGNNVLKRISLMFLDDEGTKLVYNKVNKNLELRDKRDNLLTSIPVSHFVSNIPTSIVVQNGKIKLMSGSDIIDENTISYNDLADKPELNYLPLNGGTVTGDVGLNGNLLIKDKTIIHVKENGNIAFGNKPFNDLVIGEFKGIQLWGQGNDKVVLAGGGVKNLSDFATAQSVKTAVEGIQIGGRNYVLNSKPKLTSVGYMGQYWNLSEPVVIGEQYTFSCYATIEKERILCVYFIDVSGQPRQYIIDKLVNGYNKFTVIPNYSWSGLCVFYEVLGISPTPTATIEKLKFEKGNKPTDWSPAPEDFDFFKGNIQLSDLNTFKNRETGGFSVNTGGGWGAYLNFKLEGSTSSLEFFKPNWYPSSRMGIRNSVDSSRFNDDNGGFRDLAWYDDILRAGVECTQNSNLQREHQNQTIFVTVSCSIELNTIDDLSSVSFRKVFDNGIVSFSCFGKNIIYTSDNQFDGKKGSTAVVSRYGNDCYIDIRNV